MKHIVNSTTGKYIGFGGSKTVLLEGQVEVPEAPSSDLISPFWNFETKKYYEGATEEEVLNNRIIPQQVPLWAFRQILIDENLFDLVMEKINQLPTDLKQKAINYLEYGNFINRNSQILEILGQMIGKSKTEIGTIFINADKLEL